MAEGMDNIEHVVVVIMENRSFDNLLGWLYPAGGEQPAHVIPAGSKPDFEGLAKDEYSNRYLTNGMTGLEVYASEPTTAWPTIDNSYRVPNPDPGESFRNMKFQIFGKIKPQVGDPPNMGGFLQDYASLKAVQEMEARAGTNIAAQIMQCYSADQVRVISELARSFAVCDHWYASAPCQTWPNRGFVHTGSSDGHINNDDFEPYNIDTIFNVMQGQGISWAVYTDTHYTPSLTHLQFSKLWEHINHFHKFATFQKLCSAAETAPVSDKLPAYSFVEPRFIAEPTLKRSLRALRHWSSKDIIVWPSDYHPPHNVCRGEHFLLRVYDAVGRSAYRDKILLIITFDEHGGCYDHVHPPSGAKPPEPRPFSRYDDFHFDRFGVRVPTIVVSSYVEPGTVFRASGNTPFDHTSILATLRDWKQMDSDPSCPFLPSPRIEAAPSLQHILTLSSDGERANWPEITASCQPGKDDESLDMPLNDLHLGLIVAQESRCVGKHVGSDKVAELRGTLKTYSDAIEYQKEYLLERLREIHSKNFR